MDEKKKKEPLILWEQGPLTAAALNLFFGF